MIIITMLFTFHYKWGGKRTPPMESTHCSSHGGLHSHTVKWFRRKTWSRQHFVLVRECWMVTRHQAPTFMQWHVLHLRGVLDAGAKYIVTRGGKRALVTDSTSFVCSSSAHRGCSIIERKHNTSPINHTKINHFKIPQ